MSGEGDNGDTLGVIAERAWALTEQRRGESNEAIRAAWAATQARYEARREVARDASLVWAHNPRPRRKQNP